jgi:hypothetical protein
MILTKQLAGFCEVSFIKAFTRSRSYWQARFLAQDSDGEAASQSLRFALESVHLHVEWV